MNGILSSISARVNELDKSSFKKLISIGIELKNKKIITTLIKKLDLKKKDWLLKWRSEKGNLPILKYITSTNIIWEKK